nr:LysR substrate-binding domain-containing protein [Rhizobium binae]
MSAYRRTFHTWKLIDSNNDKRVIRHQPRLTCRSMTGILDAARAGLGFGLLFESACEADLQAGRLVGCCRTGNRRRAGFISSWRRRGVRPRW